MAELKAAYARMGSRGGEGQAGDDERLTVRAAHAKAAIPHAGRTLGRRTAATRRAPPPSLPPPLAWHRSMTIESQRLDETGTCPLPVQSTSAWVHRCAKRMLSSTRARPVRGDAHRRRHGADHALAVDASRSRRRGDLRAYGRTKRRRRSHPGRCRTSERSPIAAARSPSVGKELQNRRRRPICRHDDPSHGALAVGRTLCSHLPRSCRRRRACSRPGDSADRVVARAKLRGDERGDENEARGRPATPRRQAARRSSEDPGPVEPDQRARPADLPSPRQALTRSARRGQRDADRAARNE